MELREPPKNPTTAPPDRLLRLLAVVQVLLLAAVAVALWWRPATAGAGDGGALRRDVAAKLKAAGALDESANLYDEYLEDSREPAEARARIAYSLGTTYLEAGEPEKALRWFYEAETLGAGELSGEVGQKIVHCLERLGRPHAAQAALESRVRLAGGQAGDGASDGADGEVRRSGDDPVVAKVGDEEIRRSDVDRALDQMPPQAVQALSDPARRQELLEQLVADRLLWRKAVKLEYDRDPEVRQRSADMERQLAVARMVEREVLDKLVVDPADLETFFKANAERYAQPAQAGGEPKTPTLDQVRSRVEADYRRFKAQSAYQEMVQGELAAAEVELFPERLKTDG